MKLPLTHKRLRYCSNNVNKEKQGDALSQSQSQSQSLPSLVLSSSSVSSPLSPISLIPYSVDGVVAKEKKEVTSSSTSLSSSSPSLRASEGNFVVHAWFGRGSSSACNNNSILFQFLTNRFKSAYQREPTVPIRCIVREKLNDTLVVCHNEEDCNLLLQLQNRNFNGYDIQLSRYTGTMMTDDNNKTTTKNRNTINALSSSSSLPSS